MENDIYLIYYKKDCFWYGFNTPLSLVEQIVSENDELNYIKITKNIHEKLLESLYLANMPVINIKLIQEDNIEFISDEKYIYFYNDRDDFKKNDLSQWIQGKISNLKDVCSSMIHEGLWIEINEQLKHFTWKIEDQINLKNIIEQSENKEHIYYKASGETTYELFTFEQLTSIYNTLEHNKNYNLIYVNVLCDWLKENYTVEMYNNKEVIAYGYANDEIINRMEEILYGN